jgi:hypothetical protein
MSANWFDYLSLIVIASIFFGVIVGAVYITRSVNEAFNKTHEDLKSRGLELKNGGLAVKTDKRMDREDYLDATQRGIMRIKNASSLGKTPEALKQEEEEKLLKKQQKEEKKRRKGSLASVISRKSQKSSESL